MVVALEPGLESLVSILENAGHRVVPLYGNQVAVDAVVYSKEGLESFINLPDVYAGNGAGGTLIICARNLSPDQILHILSKKSYGEGGLLEF